MVNMVIFDAQVYEAARLRISDAVVHDSTVGLVGINAVDVVNVEIADVDVVEVAGILRDQIHAATHSGSCAPVGDFQIVDFPVFLVLEQKCVFRPIGRVYHWPRSSAVFANDDWMSRTSRSPRPQVPRPSAARFEENAIAGSERRGVHFLQGLPGKCRRASGVVVIPADGVDVEGSSSPPQLRACFGTERQNTQDHYPQLRDTRSTKMHPAPDIRR